MTGKTPQIIPGNCEVPGDTYTASVVRVGEGSFPKGHTTIIPNDTEQNSVAVTPEGTVTEVDKTTGDESTPKEPDRYRAMAKRARGQCSALKI